MADESEGAPEPREQEVRMTERSMLAEELVDARVRNLKYIGMVKMLGLL